MINSSFRRAPWADVLYACDIGWWLEYFSAAALGFRGELWTIAEAARDQFKIHWIKGSGGSGLSRDPQTINTGMNSGFQALSLAALFGAARILLVGYDFQRTGGRSHWHGDHPRHLGNGGRFDEWALEMTPLARDLAAAGVAVVNCSRSTALNCFPRSTLQEAL